MMRRRNRLIALLAGLSLIAPAQLMADTRSAEMESL